MSAGATLTFDKGDEGDAIAVVKGGDMDGSILYLHQQGTKDKKSRIRKEINPERYRKQLISYKPAERIRIINKLQEALDKDLDAENLIGVSNDIIEMYKAIRGEKNSASSIELEGDSLFVPIHSADKKKREVYYIAGQSGSGKSYFARMIAENYKKLYPDREVYLISKLQEDETLDKMKIGKPKRIKLDSLVEDYPKLEEFKDCMVIFDDFDTLDAPYDKVVLKLIEDVCIMGRHTNTSCLILSHYLTNYKKTRLILNEAHHLVLYPLSTSTKAMTYVATNYAGLEPEHIKEFKRLGRWIMIKKSYPCYIISAQKAFLPFAADLA